MYIHISPVKVADLIANAQSKPAAFREWYSLMLKWEVVVDKVGNIKDEYLKDGAGRTFAGLTSEHDGLQIIGQPSPTWVTETYYRKYWVPFEGLPSSVAQITANYGLNMGKGTAIRMLQRALGVEVDGRLGPITTRAAWQTDQTDLCLKLIELGRARYEEIGTGSRARFLSGWLNRNAAIKQFA